MNTKTFETGDILCETFRGSVYFYVCCEGFVSTGKKFHESEYEEFEFLCLTDLDQILFPRYLAQTLEKVI